MFIEVVRPGETLEAVAGRSGVTVEQLVAINNLLTRTVTTGQALIIPSNRYTVREGDTFWTISERTLVSAQALQRANPRYARTLTPGAVLRIPEPAQRPAEILGYLPLTDPGVGPEDITPWGNIFTHVVVFTYLIDATGALTPIDDTNAIRAIYAADAKPLMGIANMEPGGEFSPEIARAIITQPEVRERVISSVVRTVNEKGYAGVDSDIENIDVSERSGYVDFLRELKARLGDLLLNVAVPPKWDERTFAYARGHDYAGIGAVADRVYLMNYEYSWVGGPPGPIAPLPSVRRTLLYAASLMPGVKILNGISTAAYDWPLPDTPENRARPWSQQEALQIAIRNGATIRYDENARTPWFRYEEGGQEREVWFQDARGHLANLKLIIETGVAGPGIWHLGFFAPQLPPLLQALFTRRA